MALPRKKKNSFAVDYGIRTRSAGTSRHAKHSISSKDVAWADLIFVMEQKHKQNIKQKFPQQLQHKKIIVLDIPDDYHYMDEALIALLQDVVPPYLGE